MNNGSQDLTIRDAEAQDAIGIEASFEFVDLGLPSGTLWARCNIGATNPEDHGQYFSRANVVGHEIGDGYMFTVENYQQSSGYTQRAKIIPLDAAYDAAMALMDSDWQIPSIDQYQELYNNTTQEHTTINGISGLLLTSTVDGYEDKSIFLPAGGVFLESTYPNPYNMNVTGSYWARETAPLSNKYKGKCFDFDKTSIRKSWENEQYYGLNIRAVSVKIDADSLSNRKANKSTTLKGYGITDAYTKAETDAKLATKAADVVMTGAGASAAGAKGLVPAPAAGDQNKYLRGDGTWSNELVSAAFSGTTLVFYSGGYFDGTTLMIG